GDMPKLWPLPFRVPVLGGIAEGKYPFLCPRFLLVAPRPAEGRIEAVGRERVLERFRLHDIGIERTAVGDRGDAVFDPPLVDMDDEIEVEPSCLLVAKGDHLTELPRGVDVKQRERRLARIERLERKMQHHRRILAD